MSGETLVYDRTALTTVLVYHTRVAPGKGCVCGWNELGLSWADHVADVYEQSVVAIPDLGTQARIVYDYADQWHNQAGHIGDVRTCTWCRSPTSSSPYRGMLKIVFPIDGVE